MDGTQPDEKGLCGKGVKEGFDHLVRPMPPVLQAVFFGGIVIESRLQRKIGGLSDQEIAFRRMQIAAGGIAA